MKVVRRVTEPEVIAEFLKNEFYQEEFHHDRHHFERLVLEANIEDASENALRRALLFRRRGHMWRELPADTQWWQVEIGPEDLERIRVFPRAQWRKVSNGSFRLVDITERIRTQHFSGKTRDFIAKVQSLAYRLRKETDSSSVLLIGVDDTQPLTILEGNHRLTAALLVSPEMVGRQFQVLCGLSPHMSQSCWYETNFSNLLRYAQHRFQNLFYDREADVERVRNAISPALAANSLDSAVGARKAVPGSK